MWDGEVFLTSNSSKPASSIAALMFRFMYSGMYGSVFTKQEKREKETRTQGAGRRKRQKDNHLEIRRYSAMYENDHGSICIYIVRLNPLKFRQVPKES